MQHVTRRFTLAEIAKLTQSDLVGDPTFVITNVADLESAGQNDASFLANPRYEQVMRKSKAGVIFIAPDSQLTEGRQFLVTSEPSRAFQTLVEAFLEGVTSVTGFKGVHPTAIIHPSAKVAASAVIGPYAVIDEGATIGERTQIGSHCYIGAHTVIGEDCYFYPHVTVRERCLIGNRVAIQPNAVIGSCGFGYTTGKDGKHSKLNQVGTVTIEDDVEIGASTTIDRSRFKTTKIGRGTKVDNLVQIGHGVEIGEDNIIIAQTGIAGSTKTGKHVILAGQTAIAGHLELGDGVIISARTGVSKSLPKAGKYGGVPAMPLEDYNRMSVHLRNIEKYVEELKSLKAKVDKLSN